MHHPLQPSQEVQGDPAAAGRGLPAQARRHQDLPQGHAGAGGAPRAARGGRGAGGRGAAAAQRHGHPDRHVWHHGGRPRGAAGRCHAHRRLQRPGVGTWRWRVAGGARVGTARDNRGNGAVPACLPVGSTLSRPMPSLPLASLPLPLPLQWRQHSPERELQAHLEAARRGQAGGYEAAREYLLHALDVYRRAWGAGMLGRGGARTAAQASGFPLTPRPRAATAPRLAPCACPAATPPHPHPCWRLALPCPRVQPRQADVHPRSV